MEKKITKIGNKIHTVAIEGLVPGKYYAWKDRIESSDWSDYENYDNIECYYIGQFIGIFDSTYPIFKRYDESFDDAILRCTSNRPRIIYDAMDAEKLKEHLLDMD